MRAWGVSLFAHAALLVVLVVLRFSQPSAEAEQAGAVVSISEVKMLAESSVAMPKPKVSGANEIIARTNKTAETGDIHQIFKPAMQDSKQAVDLSAGKIEANTQVKSAAEALPAKTEFFGSTGRGRRICYVVDCSGSMQGLWQRVREELFESIGGLQPDQYFCVIAFGADNIQESSSGRCVRATEQAKKDAYVFIDLLKPMGTTNALAALERAMMVRDEAGIGPSVIYFLTDGFDLGEQESSRFSHKITTMLRSILPKAQINTIGFWPGEQDSRVLGTIASQSGGEFVAVKDGGVPEAVPGR